MPGDSVAASYGAWRNALGREATCTLTSATLELSDKDEAIGAVCEPVGCDGKEK